MSKPKPIAQILGNGRGAFRKAVLSVLLQKYIQKDAFETAEKEFGKKCIYCGIAEGVNLQPDHLWPEEVGGIYAKGNIVLSCPTCNSDRGNQDWKTFLKNVGESKTNYSKAEIEKKINNILKFMKKYGMDNKPNIEKLLSKSDLQLRRDFNILLDAITQGIRAKIGNPQNINKKFKNEKLLFDELIRVSNRYLLKEK